MTRWSDRDSPFRSNRSSPPAREDRDADGYTTDVIGDVSRLRYSFQHEMDDRRWMAMITRLSVQLEQATGYKFRLSLRSDGCREVLFVTRSVDVAKDIVFTFRGLSSQYYDRLVVDAAGTTSHPVSGDVGVFKFATFAAATPYSSDVSTVEVSGLARVDGLQVYLYPQAAEYEFIFERILEEAAVLAGRRSVGPANISMDGRGPGIDAAAIVSASVNTAQERVRDTQPAFRFSQGRRSVVSREARLRTSPTDAFALQQALSEIVAWQVPAASPQRQAAPRPNAGMARGRRLIIPEREGGEPNAE